MRRNIKLGKNTANKLKVITASILALVIAFQAIYDNGFLSAYSQGDIIATYEIGANGENVKATLRTTGVLSITGTGDTKDYTAETMPFSNNIDKITTLEIEDGITSLGNYLFFGCKNLNDKLDLPATITSIGDYAFSGYSKDSAPTFTFIDNKFTSADISVPVTKTEEVVSQTDSEDTKQKEPQISNHEESSTSTDETPTGDAIKPAEDTTSQENTDQPQTKEVTTMEVKTITEQDIGTDIFFDGQTGGYKANSTNKSFKTSAEKAGYIEADRFITVSLDGVITQTLPVKDGKMIIPNLPNFGIVSQDPDDAYTMHTFSGWSYDNAIYQPADLLVISNDTDKVTLTSKWNTEWRINPQVKTEAKEEISVYSVIDANTGKDLTKVDGYAVSVQWQINKENEKDESAWKDISGANELVYERKVQSGDTSSHFRAKISILKQTETKMINEPKTLLTDAVVGVNSLTPITISYEANGGTGTIANADVKNGANYKPEENTFTPPDGKVFIGWKATLTNVTIIKNDGTAVNNNDIIKSYESLDITLVSGQNSGNITFTAQWDTGTIIYFDSVNGNDTNDGLSADKAVKTINKAYDLLPANGTMETNKIVLLNALTISTNYNFPNKNTTISAAKITEKDDIILNNGKAAQFNGDTKLENMTIYSATGIDISNDFAGLFGGGHEFVLGNGITTRGYVRVFGGVSDFNNINYTGNTHITVYSGKYLRVLGGCFNKNIYGNTYVTAYGGEGTIYGTSSGPKAMSGSGSMVNNSYVSGNVNIKRYGGSYSVVGGGRYGVVNGKDGYSAKIEIYGGSGSVQGSFMSAVVGMMKEKVLIYVYDGDISDITSGANEGNNARADNVPLNNGAAIEIYGGEIGTIIGGGNDAGKQSKYPSVNGNIDINIHGGTITGKLIAASKSGRIRNGNVNVVLENCSINNDIYIGGAGGWKRDYGGKDWYECAETDKDSKLTIKDNVTLNGDIYCGGSIFSTIHGNSEVIINGNIINTSGKTKIFAGGNGKDTSIEGTSSITVAEGSSLNADIFGGGQDGKATTVEINIKGRMNGSVFGGGKGEISSVNQSTINVEKSGNITGNIYGGGELGSTNVSTINLSGGTIDGYIFGGGNNVGVTTSNININGTVNLVKEDGAIFGGSNAKGNTQTSNITINSEISKNIYGGGLGKETLVTNSNINLNSGANSSRNIYGGGLEGEVSNALISLNSGIANNVFCGGDKAGITGTVNLKTFAGSKVTNIYGGSNSSGTVTKPILEIAGDAANIFGGGYEGGTNSGTNMGTIVVSPTITVTGGTITNLYGGGEKGPTVNTNTIIINGGTITNVFGGGKSTSSNETSIKLENNSNAIGSSVTNIYGGSDDSGVTKKSNIEVNGIVTNVYGGGKGQNTKVTETYIKTLTNSKAEYVYGGSENGTVGKATAVVMGPVEKSIYGGGYGATSTITGDTWVYVSNDVKDSIYGGGNQGGVEGNTHVDIAKGTIGTIGSDTTGNVFGGSNQAKVKGNTLVHIGSYVVATPEGAELPNQATTDISILGTVFGGGNTTLGGKDFDASDPYVIGSATVQIGGKDYQSVKIGKSIFGDGNKCVTNGQKIIDITDYTAIGTDANTSIQRASVLTINHSKVEVIGEVDSANLVTTIPYSLNRIDKLVLKSGSTLKLRKGVNLLMGFESLNDDELLQTETQAKDDTTGNKLYIRQGEHVELRVNEDVSRPGYGDIKGFAQLGRYDINDDGTNKLIDENSQGVYIMGSLYTNDEDNNVSGFLVADDESFANQGTLIKGDKITPTTNGQSWRNWTLGSQTKIVEQNLIISEDPGDSKTAQIEGWDGDGSIYRVDPQSLNIIGDSTYTIMNPDKIQKNGDENTIGLSIETGQTGWLEQNKAGYIDSYKNMIIPFKTTASYSTTDSLDMRSLTITGQSPIIYVKLYNSENINSENKKNTIVTFNIDKITEQPDGSEIKTGTIIVKLNITKEKKVTYSHALIGQGKIYDRAIQEYNYDTALEVGTTVSQKSSVTTQFVEKTDGSNTIIPNKITFTQGKTTKAVNLPVGTKILMIDRSLDTPIYYHYEVKSGVSSISLTDFIKNGKNENYIVPNNLNKMNIIFIVDFASTSSFENSDICMSLETTTNSSKKVRFGVTGASRKYDMNLIQENGHATNVPSYRMNGSFGLTVNTTVQPGATTTDTTGSDKQMAAKVQLRMMNTTTGAILPIPAGWQIQSNGTRYSTSGDSATVVLANSLTAARSDIYVIMSNMGNIPSGNYKLEISLVGGPMANYPTDTLSQNIANYKFELLDDRYSIQSTITDDTKKIISKSDKEKNQTYTLLRTSDFKSDTSTIKTKLTLWKKDESQQYQQIEIDDYLSVDGMNPDTSNNCIYIPWKIMSTLNVNLKENIDVGTYQLRYTIEQTTNGSSGAKTIELTTDKNTFIITDD
ncbi:MAG: leucine-rich repeat protein [Longibaculum sp.]